ncbi:hypothetical protein NDU88_004222 [Pleurodeles waltl]|uniref:Uncharacterized protein n=1 Tax=Pleurodeles waltl TaxID=8319 RepID=A0AAV7VGG5_PLEWA|nr:hypothetical protein NDU88_004222 [Pleurodeles waltl]
MRPTGSCGTSLLCPHYANNLPCLPSMAPPSGHRDGFWGAPQPSLTRHSALTPLFTKQTPRPAADRRRPHRTDLACSPGLGQTFCNMNYAFSACQANCPTGRRAASFFVFCLPF